MTFEEVLPYLKKHEKISRDAWDKSYIVLSDRGARYLYLYIDDKLFDQYYNLSGYDITAEDWKICSSLAPVEEF